MQIVNSLTPAEFAERWPADRANDDVTLLDVREVHELAIASIASASWIPMAQVPMRLDELDSSKIIVVMCHSGMRSMRVAQYLASTGFEHVFNLRGGIDAWSREVDHSVPRY